MSKNKIIYLSIIICLFISNVSALTFQHGSTRDVVQGYDKGWIWYHLYLKNDHATAYCFDNPLFASMFEELQRTQRDVIVTYETYLFRGFWCQVSDKYEKVIVTNVEFVDKQEVRE